MEVEMPGGLAGGSKRKLLAGESLFVTLQTLPFTRTARRVLAAAGGGQGESGVAGIFGRILE
jgi:uncharacterized protein (AIM24 family)